MAVHAITDDNFEASVQKGVVLVDFWADWCGPCKMAAPILEELSNEMTEVRFTKMNVDENQQAPQTLGITALPTFVVYKDGEVVDRVTGLLPKPQLSSLVQKHLN